MFCVGYVTLCVVDEAVTLFADVKCGVNRVWFCVDLKCELPLLTQIVVKFHAIHRQNNVP